MHGKISRTPSALYYYKLTLYFCLVAMIFAMFECDFYNKTWYLKAIGLIYVLIRHIIVVLLLLIVEYLSRR